MITALLITLSLVSFFFFLWGLEAIILGGQNIVRKEHIVSVLFILLGLAGFIVALASVFT